MDTTIEQVDRGAKLIKCRVGRAVYWLARLFFRTFGEYSDNQGKNKPHR